MNCKKCGRELGSTDKFCIGCGTPVDGAQTGGMNLGNGFSNMQSGAPSGAFNNVGGLGTKFWVRRYFFGFSDLILISFILMIIFAGFGGGLRKILAVLFGIVLIGAIGLDIYFRVIGMGKVQVDDAAHNAIAILKKRAHTKFNVDIDQIREIDPIVISGAGKTPEFFLSGSLNGAVNPIAGLFKFFVNKFTRFYTNDPVEGRRIGADGIPRYLLVQTTMYAFTDSQVLVYSGNMDIASGLIYEESVAEVYYNDINCVTQLELIEKFKAGIFKKKYYSVKYLQLDVNGISKLASFDSRLAPNVEKSLTGMGSYIREKKSN